MVKASWGHMGSGESWMEATCAAARTVAGDPLPRRVGVRWLRKHAASVRNVLCVDMGFSRGLVDALTDELIAQAIEVVGH